MPNERYHVVEFSDVLGQINLIIFSSHTEANEFMELGLKRWHFTGLSYHYLTLEELAEDKSR